MLNETYRAMLGHKSVIRETFMYGKQRAAEIGYENVFDYSLGNPSVPCPDKFTKAMQTLLAEEEPVALHGYCPSQGDPGFRTAVAAHLAKTFGLPYEQKDIFPTTGAAGAIAHAIRAVTKPGDEVLTFAPYFPEYGPYVEGTGAVLKVVPPQAPAFQPNLDAFEEMLTENVTCVLINTPNNPTGVVYSAETLTRLADILTEKSKAFGHNIFLVSDEPYRDIAFDGKKVPYPAAFYPHTLTCFSFSKSLSLPGERLGYVAVRPGCEGEDVLVDMMAQISRFTGHNCPPSIIQKATAECLDVTSDLSVYETNMDLLYDKLTELGFEVERPGGTFYIFPKALEEDANAFCLKAREFDLLLVPSDTFGVKGYVRFAYCIDTEKVKRSLPALEKLAAAYKNLSVSLTLASSPVSGEPNRIYLLREVQNASAPRISPPEHAPGQLRQPERPVGLRHHPELGVPGKVGRRYPRTLFARGESLRREPDTAARPVAPLPPHLHAPGGGGRARPAPLRGGGLRLRGGGQWPSGRGTPGRLLALHAGHHRPAPPAGT